MAQPKVKTAIDMNSAENPIDRISDILADDMKAVNTIILERMDSHVPLVKQLAGPAIQQGLKRADVLVDREEQVAGLGCVGLAFAGSFLHAEAVALRVEFNQAIKAKPAQVTFG